MSATSNSIRSPRTGIPAVDQALGPCFDSLRALLLSPFLRGSWVRGVVLPGAAAIAIAHGLGRPPQGWLVTRVRNVSPLALYEDGTKPPDATNVYFVANCTATVDLWFF